MQMCFMALLVRHESFTEALGSSYWEDGVGAGLWPRCLKMDEEAFLDRTGVLWPVDAEQRSHHRPLLPTAVYSCMCLGCWTLAVKEHG